MKKLLALLMALSAVFLFSCANDSGDDSGDENTSDSVSGTAANGQTYTSNSYTAKATGGIVNSDNINPAYKNITFTATFYLNFPTDDDTYFYKCYSGLKDGYTITYYDGSKITMPNPKAYYVQYKKSDNTINAVAEVLAWKPSESIIDKKGAGTEIVYLDDDSYYRISDNCTLTALYGWDSNTTRYAQIANINESTTFNWDGKSAVYLYHSLDEHESYSIVEDSCKIITDITGYFVNFDGTACDNNPTATAKIKLDGTDKILTITVE